MVPGGHAGHDHDRRLGAGRVGELVTDAIVETWQADPDGRFAHPDDAVTALPLRRPGSAGSAGARPTAVRNRLLTPPGRLPRRPTAAGRRRTWTCRCSHAGRRDLVTRIYFADEAEANAADPVLAGLADADRRRHPASRCAEPGSAGAVFQLRHPPAGGRRDRVHWMSEPSAAGSPMRWLRARLARPRLARLARRLAREERPGAAGRLVEGPEGAPPLVLGNSLGTSTRDLWEPQLAALGEPLPAAPLRAPRARRLARRRRGALQRSPGLACGVGPPARRPRRCGQVVVLRGVAGRHGRDVAGRERARADRRPRAVCCTSARFPGTRACGCSGRQPSVAAAWRRSRTRW